LDLSINSAYKRILNANKVAQMLVCRTQWISINPNIWNANLFFFYKSPAFDSTSSNKAVFRSIKGLSSIHDCQFVFVAPEFTTQLIDMERYLSKRKRSVLLCRKAENGSCAPVSHDILQQISQESKNAQRERNENQEGKEKERKIKKEHEYEKISEGLKSIGIFEEYMKIFIKHEINDKVLPNLKEKDLKDIDDLSVGARVRFMTWLENYQRLLLSAPASVSASTAAKTIEEKKKGMKMKCAVIVVKIWQIWYLSHVDMFQCVKSVHV